MHVFVTLSPTRLCLLHRSISSTQQQGQLHNNLGVAQHGRKEGWREGEDREGSSGGMRGGKKQERRMEGGEGKGGREEKGR